MKTFTFDKFRTERIAVWCKTRIEAEEFLKLCKENGFRWKSGASLDATSHWGTHGYATVYVAGYARPEIEWAVKHDHALLEGDLIVKEYRRNIRDDGIFPILTSMAVLGEMKFHDAPEKLERTSSAPRMACWREALEVPSESGEYTVAVRWIADGEFHTGQDIAMFNSETGNWGAINSLDEYAITHWLDGVPPIPEVIVR